MPGLSVVSWMMAIPPGSSPCGLVAATRLMISGPVPAGDRMGLRPARSGRRRGPRSTSQPIPRSSVTGSRRMRAPAGPASRRCSALMSRTGSQSRTERPAVPAECPETSQEPRAEKKDHSGDGGRLQLPVDRQAQHIPVGLRLLRPRSAGRSRIRLLHTSTSGPPHQDLHIRTSTSVPPLRTSAPPSWLPRLLRPEPRWCRGPAPGSDCSVSGPSGLRHTSTRHTSTRHTNRSYHHERRHSQHRYPFRPNYPGPLPPGQASSLRGRRHRRRGGRGPALTPTEAWPGRWMSPCAPVKSAPATPRPSRQPASPAASSSAPSPGRSWPWSSPAAPPIRRGTSRAPRWSWSLSRWCSRWPPATCRTTRFTLALGHLIAAAIVIPIITICLTHVPGRPGPFRRG